MGASASIDASGRGFGSAEGPGAGSGWYDYRSGVGGGYGGEGSPSVSYPSTQGAAYGSCKYPRLKGSGGGVGENRGAYQAGGAGGGTIELNVTGMLIVDGAIRSNGADGDNGGLFGSGESGCGDSSKPIYAGGGGSGGSVLIHSPSVQGVGTIEAMGGQGGSPGTRCGISSEDYRGGHGGGGRVAVYTAAAISASLTYRVHGSSASSLHSAAGTLYTEVGGFGTLLVDGGNTTPSAGASALLSDGPLTVDQLSIVSAHALLAYDSVVAERANISSGWLRPATYVVLTAGDLYVGASASIDASGRGFGSAEGPGAGSGWYDYRSGVGGGYGGEGSPSVSYPSTQGAAYGSCKYPRLKGSGGGVGENRGAYQAGGAGGGTIELNVTGMLIVDGAIRSNGADGDNGGLFGSGESGCGDSSKPIYAGGGGSGGSVLIHSPSVQGVGTIEAMGGQGGSPGTRCGISSEDYRGGHGGGGRVAVYTAAAISASLTYRVHGSSASSLHSAAGTVYTEVGGNRTLLVDGGSTTSSAGASVLLSDGGPLTVDQLSIVSAHALLAHASYFDQVAMSSNAHLSLNAPASVRNCSVKSGTILGGDIMLTAHDLYVLSLAPSPSAPGLAHPRRSRSHTSQPPYSSSSHPYLHLALCLSSPHALANLFTPAPPLQVRGEWYDSGGRH